MDKQEKIRLIMEKVENYVISSNVFVIALEHNHPSLLSSMNALTASKAGVFDLLEDIL